MKKFVHILIVVVVANALLLVTPGRGFIAFLHLHGAALLHLWASVFLTVALWLVYRTKRKSRLARIGLPILASFGAVVACFAALSKGAYFAGLPSAEELWAFASKSTIVGGVLTSVCWLPVGIVSSVLYSRFCRANEEPNKAPEPTPTAVTSPAAQEPRQP